MFIFLIILNCIHHTKVGVVEGARYQVVGSENASQYIQLKSQYDLVPDKKLLLPVDVPDEYIGLFGLLSPKFSETSTFKE